MAQQRLHIVFGGELVSTDSMEFRDPTQIHTVGIFPDYESAHKAWRAEAQRTVDQASTRYFIAHLHRLLEESQENSPTAKLV